MMNRVVLAVAVAFALGSTLYVAAQQPGPPPGAGAPRAADVAVALPAEDLRTD